LPWTDLSRDRIVVPSRKAHLTTLGPGLATRAFFSALLAARLFNERVQRQAKRLLWDWKMENLHVEDGAELTGAGL
jgi:hypothetical protein